MRRRATICLGLILVASAALAAGESVVRTFHLKHRSVTEVSQLVQPLLSESGSLTVHPKHRYFSVQDNPAVVRMITEIVAAVDVPDPTSRVEVRLLEASNQPPSGGKATAAVDPRIRRMFQYRAFTELGRAVLEWREPGPLRAELGHGYVLRAQALRRRLGASGPKLRTPAGMTPVPSLGANDLLMAWRLGGRSLLRSLVRVRRVVLRDLSLTAPAPKRGAGSGIEILRTNVVLSPAQQVVLAAGRDEHADRALILIIRALAVRRGVKG